jgi:hypothetical protein
MSTKISSSLFDALCFIGVVLITPIVAATESLKGEKTKRRDPFAKVKLGSKPQRPRESPRQIAAASREDRQSIIAEAAYYRAERRGFQGGKTIEDWLAAEKEIDEKLAKEKPIRHTFPTEN